eukprot:gnl/MRDRNA2_/MRDRNA2_82903_c0_seq3.p1 gnl/MRDRNA2_/MRDRNA2_82903_c0~~gnl/MRDRNA2_/MRDRNA2_82903_c0_seq3.p1  ORF type:complete len:849 (+),score=152.49 gnl/MRDRNA2_/MRDRNA2_82903_c0_seq3:99-2645(+)
MISGDDPRIVPWGDTEAFRKLVRFELAQKEGKIASDEYMFDGTYDEWAILDGNPWLNIIQRAAEMSYNKTRVFEKDPDEQYTIKAPNSQTSYLVGKGRAGPWQDPIVPAPPSSLNELLEYFTERERGTYEVEPIENRNRTDAILTKSSQKSQHRGNFLPPDRSVSNNTNVKPLPAEEDGGQENAEPSDHADFPLPPQELQELTKQVVRDTLLKLFKKDHAEKQEKGETSRMNSSSLLVVEGPSGNTSTEANTVAQNEGEKVTKDTETANQIDEDTLKENGAPETWNEAMKTVAALEAQQSPDYSETHGGLAGATPQGLMPYWCFLPYSPIFNMFSRLEQLNLVDYVDLRIQKADAAKLFWYTGVRDEESFNAVWNKLDKNKNGWGEYTELIHLVQNDKDGKIFKDDGYRGLRSICTNHHFGMFHMCGPEFIEIRWRIEKQIWSDEKISKTRWKMKRHSVIELLTRFEQVGFDVEDAKDGPTGWYESNLQIETFDQTGSHQDNWNLAMTIITLLFFVAIFLLDAVLTGICFPFCLAKLICLDKEEVTDLKEVEKRVLLVFDVRGSRRQYLTLFHIMLENIFAIVFIVAVVDSVMTCFQDGRIPLRGAQVSEACQKLYESHIMEQLKDGDSIALIGISPWKYINECMEPEGNYFAELSSSLFWEAKFTHGFAFLIISLRLLDMFNAFEGTEWLGQTVAMCLRKLMYFLCFYFFIVACFAGMVHVSFGSHFFQFRTWARAFQVLALFSFGFDGYAFEGIHTFEDHGSFVVTMQLLMFSIMITTISMNFFITIILDAYNAVKAEDSIEEREKLEEERTYFIRMIAFLCFPRVDTDQKTTGMGGYTISRIMRP